MVSMVLLFLSGCSNSTDGDNSNIENPAVESNAEEREVETDLNDNETAEDSSSSTIEDNENVEEAMEESVDYWNVAREVDDFGDIVEDGNVFLTASVTGDFSNTATTSSELLADVTLLKVGENKNDYNEIYIFFRLYEYGNNPVIPSSYDAISMKIKAEDDIYEFGLEGADDAVCYLPHGRAYGRYIYNCLCLGMDVRCIITIGNSQYNFTLESQNFVDACESVGYEVYEIPEEITDIHTALKHLNNEEQWEYGDAITAFLETEYLKYDKLNDEDIAAEIVHGFWSLNDPNWNAYNTEYEFLADGTYNDVTPSQYDYGQKVWKIEDNHLCFGRIPRGDTEPKTWVPYEVRKIEDGYYLLMKENGEIGYVMVRLNDDLTPQFAMN